MRGMGSHPRASRHRKGKRHMRKAMFRALLFVLCLVTPLVCFAQSATQDIEAMASGILLSNSIAGTYEETTQPAVAATALPAADAAETPEPLESPFRFSVLPILPDNQEEDVTAYFSLNITPGQPQTLQVEVTNLGYEPITVSLDVARAMTNENGLIQYASNDSPDDESLQADISTFVSFEDTKLSLEAQETRTISILIDTPEAAFDGTLLGGLVFVRDQNEAEQGSSDGMVLGSLYSYVVPLRLRSTGASSGTIEPAFALQGVSTNLQTVFGHRTILSIRNPQPLIVKPITLAYALYAAGDEETPVATHANDSIEMAPNTIMNYSIPQEETLEPGTYTARVTIEYQGHTSAFEETLTIGDA